MFVTYLLLALGRKPSMRLWPGAAQMGISTRTQKLERRLAIDPYGVLHVETHLSRSWPLLHSFSKWATRVLWMRPFISVFMFARLFLGFTIPGVVFESAFPHSDQGLRHKCQGWIVDGFDADMVSTGCSV